MTSSQQAGGFIPALPSPAPSSASTSAYASSPRHGRLPQPRTRALAPGCSKEDMVRRFADDKLSEISRRYVKKFSDEAGFQSFGEVARELDGVVDVLWKSGTPSLQIPFLLKLASDFTSYVRSFPPAPRPTFDLLRKLDHCFASLLLGQDIDTHRPLPGFENGLARGMTTTDMVRCRSLVGQTRILMVELMSMGEMDDDDDDDDDEEEEEEDGEDEEDGGYDAWEDEDDRMHLDAARVYQYTIVQLERRLGNALGTAGPGQEEPDASIQDSSRERRLSM